TRRPRSTSSPGWRTPHVRRRSPRRSPRSWAAPTPLPDPAAPNAENFAARPRGPTHGEYGHMTTPAQTQASEAPAQRATGRVARVTGAVIDIEFPPGAIPELYNALTIEISDTGSGLEASTLTLETAQHLGDGMVRGIALKPTDGVVRGQAVHDTGAAISVPVGDAPPGPVLDRVGAPANQTAEPRGIALEPTAGVVRGQAAHDTGAAISVPVGDATLGTVFDVVGSPLNKPLEQLEVTERWPIHRQAPNFDQLESKTSMFETGI